MSSSLLSKSDIDEQLATTPSWHIINSELTRTFELTDFRAALAFVNQVGELAESANHHPDIDIRYNKVRFALVTHSAGGLTKNDFDLAARIDSLR
jgi:4a-hydroxytetrahydrobiopterin dehydratase